MLESAACWVDEKSWKKCSWDLSVFMKIDGGCTWKINDSSCPLVHDLYKQYFGGKTLKHFFFNFLSIKSMWKHAQWVLPSPENSICNAFLRGDSTTFMSVETYSDITPKLIKELCCRKPKDSVSVSWQNNGMMERLSSLKFINTASNARWHPVQRVRSAKDGAVHSLGTITVNFRQGQKRTQSKLNVWEWC